MLIDTDAKLVLSSRVQPDLWAWRVSFVIRLEVPRVETLLTSELFVQFVVVERILLLFAVLIDSGYPLLQFCNACLALGTGVLLEIARRFASVSLIVVGGFILTILICRVI